MKPSLTILLGSAVYATVRYNIFQGVPWTDLPMFTMNKAFAVSALILLVWSVIGKVTSGENDTARTLQMAGVFAAIHVVLSLALLSPAYFEKFFMNGKFTAEAGITLMLGAVAAAVMAAGSNLLGKHETDVRSRNIAILALIIGVHAAVQGIGGWFTPSEWPGLMPPITLIAFVLGLTAVAAVIRFK